MPRRFASMVASVTVVCGAAAAARGGGFPAAWLPGHGAGYLVPQTWAERGLRYGRPELVRLVERVALRVADDEPGAVLYVGDLSLRSGRWTQWHRSHRRGIDADLLFYARDGDGRPAPVPTQMTRFDANGVGETADGSRLVFDVARNWALVRALLTDPETQVVRIFVSHPLRDLLLEHARDLGEEPALVERAAEVLVQPGDSAPHDDHFHVRIAGPPGSAPRAWARGAKARGRQGRGHGHGLKLGKLHPGEIRSRRRGTRRGRGHSARAGERRGRGRR